MIRVMTIIRRKGPRDGFQGCTIAWNASLRIIVIHAVETLGFNLAIEFALGGIPVPAS